MQYRDPHSALKSQVVASSNKAYLEARVARMQWGKEDVAYSLHVYPSSFTSSGLQKTDFLAYLGFQRSDTCTFTGARRCYVKWVSEEFDPNEFLNCFETAFTHAELAQRNLEGCGLFLPQPEGWAFHYGRSGSPSWRGPDAIVGDGHTAREARILAQSEDEIFNFTHTFIETGDEKGFVTHYRPKHPPLSAEIRDVFRYIKLREFPNCPENDFDQCYYRTIKYIDAGRGVFDNNTESAHSFFNAHATHFSPGVKELLAANEAIESAGMTFLPFEKAGARMHAEIEQRIIRPRSPSPKTIATASIVRAGVPSNFDVAISVAGSDKNHARKLAELVTAAGFSVFFYEFFPEYLWGKNLATTFDEIFRKRSRFCVIFVSKDYAERVWTSHEMRSAQARALEEKGSEYILPIRLDNTELEALLPTTSYLPIEMGIERIGELLIRKLQS